MRKHVEISDKFDSASETEWVSSNWELAPHTRDIQRFLLPAAILTAAVGLMGTMFYAFRSENAEIKWRDGMRVLYAPYQAAVIQIEKLEYCDTSRCSEWKRELTRQRDEAWKRLCGAENPEEYIRRLRNDDLPYQPCD